MKDVTNSIHDHDKSKFHEFFGMGGRHGKSSDNDASFVKWLRRFDKFLWVVYIVVIALYYYMMLPPIHYAAMDFWVFLLIIVVGFIIVRSSEKLPDLLSGNTIKKTKNKFVAKYPLIAKLVLGVGVLIVLAQLIMTPLLFSKHYANFITVDQKEFQADFAQTDLSKIPLIDRDTAARLGNRKIGALSNLVSQFEAAPDYTLININNEPFRVTPLQYAGFFRWLNNQAEGIPHYLKVDMVSGDVTIEKPSQAIKYSFADILNRNVRRKLRFSYPFKLFANPSFEVDDEGNPYYVASTYRRHFLFLEPEVEGLVTLNAMTGETQYYAVNDVPKWVDRVYSADLITHQLNLNGRYKNGFWNSVSSKVGVTQTTEGYNYLPINDDIYLYTGITSVNSDESNIGFVLVNMRTKESAFYPVTSADEFSAMESAEGSIQEKGYNATFPLLININGTPMYILSLKDGSGLIKAYALIDVQNYQNVYVDTSVSKLIQKYTTEVGVNVTEATMEETLRDITGQIDQIQATVIDGDTVYYFMVDGSIYRANITLSEHLPFVIQGDEVEFKTNDKGIVREFNLLTSDE